MNKAMLIKKKMPKKSDMLSWKQERWNNTQNIELHFNNVLNYFINYCFINEQ